MKRKKKLHGLKVINTTSTERVHALVTKTVNFANINEPTASIAEAQGLAVRLNDSSDSSAATSRGLFSFDTQSFI